MKTSESLSKIAPALVAAQSAMGNAKKDATNPFFKSSYADLNSIRQAVMPPLHENGISVLQPTVTQDGKSFVETVLLHTSGEYIAGLTEIIADKQHNAQSAGSGISYARRYGLQALLNVGAEDDDGEAAVARPKPQQAKPVPVASLDARHAEAMNLAFDQAAQEQSTPPPRQQSKSPDAGLSSYVVQFGKFKGKPLSEISEKEIVNYIGYLKGEAEKKNESLSKNAADFIKTATAYLDSAQPRLWAPKWPGSKQDESEKIPF